MNFILYAVPCFFVLIAVELLTDRWRGVSNYPVADAINSLSTGVCFRAKYPMAKPDLSQFRKFEVPLDGRQQLYVALQFTVYIAPGSYLMNLADSLPTAALVVGWSAVAFGLFVLGVALENRQWAFKLELLRLALNVPLVWLAPILRLWPASAVGWVGLLSYSLLSGIGLYCC